MMRALIWLSLVCTIRAEWDTYPVKSISLTAAPSPQFYVSPDVSSYGIFDVHPVHGCKTSDGSYVMTGKALEGESSSVMKAFAVKLTSTGTVAWVWGSNADGVNDAANAVLQLPNGGDLIVAGYRAVGGKNQRSLTKLSFASGSEEWTATWPDSAGAHGAWEMIQLTTDGASVLLAGLIAKPDNEEFNFKSYGNVPAGTANIVQLPVSVLAAATAPAEAAKTWDYTNDAYVTSKTAMPLADGSVVALLYGAEKNNQQATLVKLSSAGAVIWGPTYYPQHGEGTDLAIAADGSGFVISGQGDSSLSDGGVDGSLSGRLTKVNSAGVWQWSKSYSSIDYTLSATAKLIKNECWGIQALSDGYVVGCGTGIENCNDMSGQMLADCNAGTADPRTGAIPRKASVWQSMIFRTDMNGALKWQRVDQYRPADAAPLGTAGYESRSSASEFVLVTSDGFVSINDEVSGIGLLKLKSGAASPSGPSGSSGTTSSPPPPAALGEGEEGDEGSGNMGAIIGGVVGAIVVIGAIGFVYMKFVKKPPQTTAQGVNVGVSNAA